MAAKKIRKREYIPPSHEVVNRKERAVSTATKASRASVSRTSPAKGGARGGAAYEYPQPSYRRTLRRLPIYFVMIFALQYFLPSEGARDSSDGKRLLTAFVLALAITVVFAPFMHVMDRMAYNRWLKRSGRSEG